MEHVCPRCLSNAIIPFVDVDIFPFHISLEKSLCSKSNRRQCFYVFQGCVHSWCTSTCAWARHKKVSRLDTGCSKIPKYTIKYPYTRLRPCTWTRALDPNSGVGFWKKVCLLQCPERIVLGHCARKKNCQAVRLFCFFQCPVPFSYLGHPVLFFSWNFIISQTENVNAGYKLSCCCCCSSSSFS